MREYPVYSCSMNGHLSKHFSQGYPAYGVFGLNLGIVFLDLAGRSGLIRRSADGRLA